VLYMQDAISAVQYLAIALILFSVALPNVFARIKSMAQRRSARASAEA